MDVVLPPHLHHHHTLGARSPVLWYYEEPMSLLGLGRDIMVVLCWVCPGDTQSLKAPAHAAERLFSKVNGQILASFHPSLRVHLKVAMAFHSFGGGPFPSCYLDK